MDSLPRNKKITIRKFLNCNEDKIAAILCKFDTVFFHPNVQNKKTKEWSKDKTKVKSRTRGYLSISDCRKAISLDFYDKDINNIKKLNIMIDALTACRDFIVANPSTCKDGEEY